MAVMDLGMALPSSKMVIQDPKQPMVGLERRLTKLFYRRLKYFRHLAFSDRFRLFSTRVRLFSDRFRAVLHGFHNVFFAFLASSSSRRRFCHRAVSLSMGPLNSGPGEFARLWTIFWKRRFTRKSGTIRTRMLRISVLGSHGHFKFRS